MAALRRKRELIAVRCPDYFDTESQDFFSCRAAWWLLYIIHAKHWYSRREQICLSSNIKGNDGNSSRTTKTKVLIVIIWNISLKFIEQNIIQVYPTANLPICCSSSSNCQQFLICALLLQCIQIYFRIWSCVQYLSSRIPISSPCLLTN